MTLTTYCSCSPFFSFTLVSDFGTGGGGDWAVPFWRNKVSSIFYFNVFLNIFIRTKYVCSNGKLNRYASLLYDLDVALVLFNASKVLRCPLTDIEKHELYFPLWGMPLSFPPLDEEYMATLLT